MADSKPRIRIEYCVPCGAKPYATALVDRLFDEYEQDVAAIDIVMGSKVL